MRAPGARRGSTAWWRLWLRTRRQGPPPAPHDAPLPWRQRVAHTLVVLAGWLLFAWCWRVVTADHPSVGQLSDLLLGALVVVPVFTVSWVVHNVGIHRRKGPRRSVPVVVQRYERDYNGRTIHADWAALAAAQRIDVVIDGDGKHFVAASTAPGHRPGGSGPGPGPETGPGPDARYARRARPEAAGTPEAAPHTASAT